MDSSLFLKTYVFDWILNFFQNTLIASIFIVALIAGVTFVVLFFVYKYSKRIKCKLFYRIVNKYKLEWLIENILIHVNNDFLLDNEIKKNKNIEESNIESYQKNKFWLSLTKIVNKLQFLQLIFSNKIYFRFKLA